MKECIYIYSIVGVNKRVNAKTEESGLAANSKSQRRSGRGEERRLPSELPPTKHA